MLISKQNFDYLKFSLVVLSFLFINYKPAFNQELTKPVPHFVEIATQSHVNTPGRSTSATWVDFNEDGLLDIFVCNGYNQANALYKNLGNGVFKNIAQKAGLINNNWSDFSLWIDFDNNGLLDLFVANNINDLFFQNTGTDSFIFLPGLLNLNNNSGIAWADFNNDGKLDAYITRNDANRKKEGSPYNLLYKNLGNKKFEEMGHAAGVAGEDDSGYPNWIDYDNDGDLDLFVTALYGQQDHLYRNNGNETFTDVFSSTNIKEFNSSSYWADFNNDGWIDLFIPDKKNPRLYKNNKDGTFTDITEKSGLSPPPPPSFPLAAQWFDFDNDGYLDLHYLLLFQQQNKSKFISYHNNHNEQFTNIENLFNTEKITYSSNDFIWGDFDNDGNCDVYFSRRYENLLFHNESNNNNWIKIRLKSSISNKDAYGTKIKIVCDSLIQYRDIGVGQSFKSPTRQTLQFGVAKHSIIDSIIIRWPSGIIQDTVSIAANQEITIREPTPPLFSDVTASMGLADHLNKSFSAAFVDLNDDEFIDLCVTNHKQGNLLYRNDKGKYFSDITSSARIDYNVFGCGIGFGDFDNDGFVDIYWALAGFAENILLHNLGNTEFADITKTARVGSGAICSYEVILADFNSDGYLDIYVGNDGPNKLYLNRGNLKFDDVSTFAGVDDSLISYGTAADYDNDGDIDIYIANNRGGYDEYPIKDYWPNRLYRNNGDGTFTDVASEAGVQDGGNTKGCCFGDYDNDGFLDLYIGNDGSANRLFHNNGDGTFTDQTEVAGVAAPLGTHGVTFDDFDNDGYLDIYACGGSYIPEKHDYCLNKDHPDKLYHNNGDGTFTDISHIAGIDFNKALTSSLCTGDYDNDGDVDIYLVNSIYKGSYKSPNILLKNNNKQNHWLEIKLQGNKSNRSAIGTRVYLTAGDMKQMREVCGGIGGGAQNSLTVEFGLGTHKIVNQLTIRWPSKIIQKLKNIEADQLLIIEEPFQIGAIQLSQMLYKRLKIILICFIIAIILSISLFYMTKKAPLTLITFKKRENQKPSIKEVTSPILLAIKINLVKFRGEYLLTHSVNFKHGKIKLLSSSHTPYPIKEIKIIRILQQIEQLKQYYAHYIHNNMKLPIKPIDLLREIGEKIYLYLGLTGLLSDLFTIKFPSTVHLKLELNNLIIPWQWAYHPDLGQFLCDKFPYAISFSEDEEKPTAANIKMRGGASAEAILFYGDWKGHPKELKHVSHEIEEIERILRKSGFHIHHIYQDSDLFADTIRQLNLNAKNLRLIHYSGHIDQNRLDLSENDLLAVDFLRNAYGLEFPTKPLIFLNGCQSGQLTNIEQKHENLAAEFMGCGATACVVTEFQIPELAAKNFALRFYNHFIGNKMTVAQAIQQARFDMTTQKFSAEFDPDYDITRYFYNLYGNPAVKF